MAAAAIQPLFRLLPSLFSAAFPLAIISSECLTPRLLAGGFRCFLPGASTLPPLRAFVLGSVVGVAEVTRIRSLARAIFNPSVLSRRVSLLTGERNRSVEGPDELPVPPEAAPAMLVWRREFVKVVLRANVARLPIRERICS